MKIQRKLWILTICLLVIGQLCSCKSDENVSTEEVPEFTYVSTFETIELGENTYINQSKIIGETWYYTTNSYKEETGVSTTVFTKYDIANDSAIEMNLALTANEYIQSFTVKEDGSVVMMTSEYIVEDEDYANAREVYCLKEANQTGEILGSYDLTALCQEEYFYVEYMEVDQEGNVYLYTGNDSITVLDAQGQLLFTVSVSGWVSAMSRDSLGNVMVSYYGNEGMELGLIDVTTKSMGSTYSDFPMNGNMNTMISMEDGTVLMSMDNSFVSYNMESKEMIEILNWISCDIDGNDIQGVAVLPDESFAAILLDYSSSSPNLQLAKIEKIPTEEVVVKEEITLGTLYVNQSVKEEVIAFNKANETYRIRVVEYMADDYDSAVTRMNADLVSGDGPDIFDFSSNTASIEQYASQGVIEDLYPYLEKDPELEKEDYVQSLLDACSVDGKLCVVVPTFCLSTLVGKTSEIGEGDTWTIKEAKDIMESKPEGTELFEYASKGSVLYMAIMNDMDSYVDWSSGQCYFNTPEFKEVLEFVNLFPDDEDLNYDVMGDSSKKLQEGTVLSLQTSIDSVQSYQMYDLLFGEEIVCKGYPNNGGIGVTLQGTGVSLAMNAGSEQKEDAWEFMRIFFTEEYQGDDGYRWWGFPSKISVLEAQFAEDMKPEMGVDWETGEEIEMPKTSWGWNDFSVDIYAAKEEEIDAIWDLINNASGASSFDYEIYEILNEECESYFEGQKSVDEVVDIIQSRVSIYVSENS